MLTVVHRENATFTREQCSNRHGRYVRWFSVNADGVRIEVVASSSGLVTVTGTAKSQPAAFANDMGQVLELAAWAARQLRDGVDVMKLKW